MNINTIAYFLMTFSLTVFAAVVVSFLWNLIFHSAGSIEWETSFRLGIILGIVLTWTKYRESKKGT